MAVLPSADSATEKPCTALPIAPEPRSLLPCWVHPPALRVKTHAAPGKPLLSVFPPTIRVLPSADNATEKPCCAAPTAPLPTSFGPCCANCASAARGERSIIAEIRIKNPAGEISQTRSVIERPIDCVMTRVCYSPRRWWNHRRHQGPFF